MIGKLFGHTQVQTSARYAHLPNESVKASGSRVGDNIGAHIARLSQHRHLRKESFRLTEGPRCPSYKLRPAQKPRPFRVI